jgi:long-subunit acyl-CoA synthetase (AMP-forming)
VATTSHATDDVAGICAQVLAEGSVDDGYHMYYTSGTTGRPKGVVLSHRIVVQHAVGTIRGTLLLYMCHTCLLE